MTAPTTITIERDEKDSLWSPIAGIEAQLLLERKKFSGEDASKVLTENLRILSMCQPPEPRGSGRTGLIIGYVQSGKTLSFTTVTALARDNGYRLIIVLAGTKTNLLDQNQVRLTGDLGILQERGKFWRSLVNPRYDPNAASEIQDVLSQWDRYPDRPERCRTLLVVVMKNATRLNELRKLLAKCDLARTCAIIIDDEGDQAGLNTMVNQDEESATYSTILKLRGAIPSHTYLQYTATPQAPLLISRIDMLSPEFAELLEPGSGYVGGKDLFASGSPFVKQIPSEDLPGGFDPNDGPPASLQKAMRYFFLGAAAGVLDGRDGNRTLMIHPSHLTTEHETYATWARSIKQGWQQVLGDDGSPDIAILKAEFEVAYHDLASTAPALPSFEELWTEICYAMEDTTVRVVNASGGRIPIFNWTESYGFILVGGAGLDRGFTVEGLTVTYMPRGAGTGTADTIQQRARFFGYKRDHIGLIRIFVDKEIAHAYTAYVTHEESLRASLKAHRGQPLTSWKRRFFLDRSLKPTRNSVMALDYMRGRAKEWVYSRSPLDEPMASENRNLIDSFRGELGPHQSFPGSEEWTEAQQPLVWTGLSLQKVYEFLLVPLKVEDEEDATDHLMIMMQIREALDVDEGAPATLYLMSAGERRERAVTSKVLIENLFQGANPNTGYPGDRYIRDPSQVTIQVHHLDLHRKDRSVVATNQRVVAVSVPESMRKDTFEQEES